MRTAPINLLKAYRALLKTYGHQHWWPVYRATSYQPQATSRVRIRPELVEGRPGGALQRCSCPKRFTEADRFQICVGAILTQNTAWTNVERALSALVRAATSRQSQAAIKRAKTFSPPLSGRGSERGWGAAPWSPAWIASLRRDRLAQLIRPAGYFNQKAKKLQIFSRWLLERYDGSLARFFRQPTEQCRTELLSLWGIGPETADSMLLYAGRHPVFVIDAYTKRWLEVAKLGVWPLRTYDEYQRFFMDRLPHDAQLFNELHALIVAWGKDRKRYQVPSDRHDFSPSFRGGARGGGTTQPRASAALGEGS